MTQVMDGVRRTVGVRQPVAAQQRPVMREAMRPISAATSRANRGVRYVTGMDGVRRAVRTLGPTATGPANQPVTAQPIAMTQAQPKTVAAVGARRVGRSWLGWRRLAAGAGFAVVALAVSGVTVRALSAPKAVTAHAEAVAATAAPSTPSATPSPSPSTPAPSPTTTPAPTPRAANLQHLLDGFVAVNGSQFGIVVKDLKTGETAAINPSRQIMSASLYKLFVAQRIYQRIDLGQLGYGDAAGGGSGRTIDGCLTVMINVSDNTCGRALGAILGWGNQNPALKIEGYKETNLATPQQTSAEDVALLLNRLYDGTLLSTDATARFMRLLKDQRVNNRLPLGLPKGTVIAHKTGDLDGVVHDAGIVYGPKTNYLVVVVSGPWATPGTAPAKFIDLSRQLWSFFEQ